VDERACERVCGRVSVGSCRRAGVQIYMRACVRVHECVRVRVRLYLHVHMRERALAYTLAFLSWSFLCFFRCVVRYVW